MTDPIPPHEYKAEEDTQLFKSIKTQRGPLQDDWIEEYNNNPGKTPIMCAYKLCKVEFRYWGMQSKIERFIHDVGAYTVTDGWLSCYRVHVACCFYYQQILRGVLFSSHLSVRNLMIFSGEYVIFSIVSPQDCER